MIAFLGGNVHILCFDGNDLNFRLLLLVKALYFFCRVSVCQKNTGTPHWNRKMMKDTSVSLEILSLLKVEYTSHILPICQILNYSYYFTLCIGSLQRANMLAALLMYWRLLNCTIHKALPKYLMADMSARSQNHLKPLQPHGKYRINHLPCAAFRAGVEPVYLLPSVAERTVRGKPLDKKRIGHYKYPVTRLL